MFSEYQREQPANAVAEAEGDAAPSQQLLAEQAVQPTGMNQPGVTLQTVRTLQSAVADGPEPARRLEAGGLCMTQSLLCTASSMDLPGSMGSCALLDACICCEHSIGCSTEVIRPANSSYTAMQLVASFGSRVVPGLLAVIMCDSRASQAHQPRCG